MFLETLKVKGKVVLLL